MPARQAARASLLLPALFVALYVAGPAHAASSAEINDFDPVCVGSELEFAGRAVAAKQDMPMIKSTPVSEVTASTFWAQGET